MSWHDLIPKTKISQETMEALKPVMEGESLFHRGQYLEAEAMYGKALDIFPPKSAGRVLIFNKLGILYEKMGDTVRALYSYEKSVEEGALTPFTYQRLCCLNLEAGRFSQALNSAHKGIKALKKARTSIPHEIYFWLVFQRLKRKISSLMRRGQRH